MQFPEICGNLKGDQVERQDFCPPKHYNVYLQYFMAVLDFFLLLSSVIKH